MIIRFTTEKDEEQARIEEIRKLADVRTGKDWVEVHNVEAFGFAGFYKIRGAVAEHMFCWQGHDGHVVDMLNTLKGRIWVSMLYLIVRDALAHHAESAVPISDRLAEDDSSPS